MWNSQINRVTHLRGSQAVSILEQSRQSKSWKKKGLLIGEMAYLIKLPSTEKSKNKTKDDDGEQPLRKDGWCFTHTMQLAPDQAVQLVSFLEQHEATLQTIVQAEEAETRKVLGRVYSLILSWKDEREKKVVSPEQSEVAEEMNAVPNGAVSIPQGKYLTIAQVAEKCDVKERTVSAWLKNGLMKGLNLPGLGQIVEEKEIEKYLAKKRNRS